MLHLFKNGRAEMLAWLINNAQFGTRMWICQDLRDAFTNGVRFDSYVAHWRNLGLSGKASVTVEPHSVFSAIICCSGLKSLKIMKQLSSENLSNLDPIWMRCGSFALFQFLVQNGLDNGKYHIF